MPDTALAVPLGGAHEDPVVEPQVVAFARRIFEQFGKGPLVRPLGDDHHPSAVLATLAGAGSAPGLVSLEFWASWYLPSFTVISKSWNVPLKTPTKGSSTNGSAPLATASWCSSAVKALTIASATVVLLEHGYSEEDCVKFLGGNMYRVMELPRSDGQVGCC